jgi:uncharacterized membrane protein
LVALLIPFLSLSSAPNSTHVDTEELITLDLQPSASVMELKPHYEEEKTFLSEIYESEHSFQLLALNWEQELPQETAASLEIRFKNNKGTWSDWQEIESDQDGAENSSYVLTSDSTAFQYRAFLSTEDTALTPKLANISFDYVDGGTQSTAAKLSRLIFKDDDEVISRNSWGADEDYRLVGTFYDESEYEYETYDETDEDEDSDRIEITELITEDEDGNALLWPLEYPESVEKIIVHHTATTDDLDDPEQAIRAIYYYHAVTKGWGDIGYNFIIAPDGKTYEGRYGGDGVVAGHAAGYNTGSVGIALLGNYEESPVSGEAMQSLTGLIYEKSKTHNIDPDAFGKFEGEVIANILGHRDVGATACPGDYLYEMLDDIADVVGASLDVRRHRNSDDEFAFDENDDLELINLEPQSKAEVSIEIENIGTETWDSDTFLTVNANHEADEIITIEKDENKVVAMMKESSVEPGETANFEFEVESGLNGGLAHFDMSPIFNGEEKTMHYMDLAVYVERSYIDFEVSDTDVEKILHPGEATKVEVVLENTGNVTWTNSGDNKTELKDLGSSSLVDSTVLASLEEDEVAPGEEGTFEFEIKAPSVGGSYTLYYAPVIEDSNAIQASSSRLSIQVTGSAEDASITNASDDLFFETGESRYLWITVENTSKEKWDAEDFTLDFDLPEGVEVLHQKVVLKGISTGISTKVYFQVQAPEEAGDYSISLRPQLDEQDLISSDYEIEITVGDEEVLSASQYENPIRILLTPDDQAEKTILSSEDSFSLYDDSSFIKTFSASSRVGVTLEGDGFLISSGSYKWKVDGPVRLTPSNDEVMRVLTMKQLASWDTSINDNKFRGTIEIYNLDGEAILINELPLEEYLKGLAEETNDTPEQKREAMAILARSYAYFYMTQDEKFEGMPYHLDDDPATSQKYLGYGYELRHPNIPEAVEDTEGIIVTYDDEVIKTPYFSRSDGVATKSAEEVWGWTHTPYLVSVADEWCDSDAFWGHGVGLSGCGAKAMAQAGYSFEEIIKYYYTGVELGEIK